MAIKKFNSVGGFTIGESGIVVVDDIGNVAAANLTVSGNTTIAGNLTVTGNLSYIETQVMYVTDPIVEQGGGINGADLTTNDGKDRGILLHYYDTTQSQELGAFIGWDNSNAEFVLSSNVSINNDVVTYNDFGKVRAGNISANYFIGDGSQLSNIAGSQVVGGVAVLNVDTGLLSTNKIVSKDGSIPVNVNTLIDTFALSVYRSAKYIIRASNDLGFESLEALLIHDDSDSYITIYGAISTMDEDIIVISTNVSGGNVNLYASGIAANTTINLVTTYIKD
jgi:hypothetical protein